MSATSGIGNTPPENFFSCSLPQDAFRLDLFDLRHDSDFASLWVKEIFSHKEIIATIEPHIRNEQPLRHLFFESRNRERLFGQSGLAFGYPILALQHDGGLRTGPLFFWTLQMDPGPNASEAWMFNHPPKFTPRYNPVIWSVLESIRGESLLPELEIFLAASKMDAEKLRLFILNALESLHPFVYGDVMNPTPCPDSETLGTMTEPAGLFWSGLIGLLPENPKVFEEIPIPTPAAVTSTGHPFGVLDLDPWQASAFRHARESRITVASGISGTGKTQLVTNLILNALSNGQKCLVVAPIVPTLREIQQNLGRQGIQMLDLLIRDVHYDQPAVRGLIRAAIQAPPTLEAFPSDRFKLLVEKASRMQEKFDAAYHASRKIIFGDHAWMETAGLFLQSQQLAGKELLGQQLYTQDYTFTYEEYEQLRLGVSECQKLYPRVNTLKHPLSLLHHALFTQKSKKESLIYIQQHFSSFTDRAEKLHRRYIHTLNSYSDKLDDLFHQQYQTIQAGIFHLNGLLTDYYNQLGNNFERSADVGLILSRFFSRKSAAILEARAEVCRAYDAIESSFLKLPVFPFSWLKAKARRSIPKIRLSLAALEEALAQWQAQLPLQIQEEVNRLSSKGLNPNVPFEVPVAEIEDGLDSLLADLKTALLFEQPFQHQALTLPQRLKYLEDVLESLDHIRMSLKNFDDFYDWQHHWLGLQEKGRKIVRALVKAKPQDWSAALDSWYFHQCLSRHFSAELPIQPAAVSDFSETLLELRPLLLSGIRTSWDKRREAAIRELRRAGKKNALNTDGDITLHTAFRESGSILTDIFPVIFATPEAATTIFDQGADFDFIMVEEAQAMPTPIGAHLLSLGKRALVIGDPTQLNQSNDNLFLKVGNGTRQAPFPLRLVHRQRPAYLLQNVFPVSVVAQETPEFQFTHIHGLFHPESGINEQEAQAVLQWLNRLKATPQRTFPSVGILCGTPQQRDLISYFLLKIKQKNDRIADVIQQLERNGLGIFSWGEIHGQHFDEVVLSITFGPDRPGNSSINLDALNTPASVSQIAALMSRANHKTHALCSIEENDLQKFADNPQNQGAFLLANYLLWIDALQQKHMQAQVQILHRIQKHFGEPASKTDPSRFLLAVENALGGYIGKEKAVLEAPLDFIRLPLAITDGKQQKYLAAIFGDGSFYYTPHTDWVWEYRIHQKLKAQNTELLPVSSADWWRDAKEEARKLAGKVLKL